MDKNKLKENAKFIIITLGILVILIFLLWNFDKTFGYVKKLFSIIRPLIIGGVIAFILNRPVLKFQKLYSKLLNKDRKKLNKKTGLPKAYYGLSMVTVYILFIAIFAGIIWFIIPQLAQSVTFFIDNFDNYYKNFEQFLDNRFGKFDFEILDKYGITEKVYTKLYSLTEYIPDFISKTFGVTADIISGIIDVFIGLIFSAYVLCDKKKLKSQVSKIVLVIFKEKKYRTLKSVYDLTSNSFSRFIGGQLTEAFILGILCFIGMKILGFEFALLISVIIGVTNLIPIFGPIFGTIPCALILLLVNPMHAVWFVVFIIILQQIDSNLIYPRVVGNYVGLSPLWTLAAITVGGGLFGVLGMILAVPAMSVIYTLVGRYVNKKYRQHSIAENDNDLSHIKPSK